MADLFLTCFIVGCGLSLFSFIVGGHHFGGDLGHGDFGGHDAGHDGRLLPFNFASATVFLAWFGGCGYLLTRYTAAGLVLGLLASVAAGLAGAALVAWFLGKLSSGKENLDAADYRIVGLSARVISPIRAGGTGEIIYTLAGSRCTSGARADDGTAFAKDAEVVITRSEKGIVFVRCWKEEAKEAS